MGSSYRESRLDRPSGRLCWTRTERFRITFWSWAELKSRFRELYVGCIGISSGSQDSRVGLSFSYRNSWTGSSIGSAHLDKKRGVSDRILGLEVGEIGILGTLFRKI